MSAPLRIVHAADLHLDSPFQGLGEQASQRRAEQRLLLERIVKLCWEKQAQLLLLAGDLLDTGSVYAETGRSLCRSLGELDCPVFIAPGNHDYYCPDSPYARLELPENVHIFRRGELECVPLPELGARIWGAAFTDAVSGAMLSGVHVEKAPDTLDICLIHGEVTKTLSRYDPISEEDIAGSGMDYIALGHVHTYSGLCRAGETYYAWPGCAEGRGFDECGEKGVIYLEVSSGACQAQFVPICGRKYRIDTVDLSAPDWEALLPEGDGRDICRLVLTGETPTPPDTEKIARMLKERFFALQVRDETTLSADVWQRAEQDTLRGAFLRRLRDMYEQTEDEAQRRSIIQAARWGLAALDGGEAVDKL